LSNDYMGIVTTNLSSPVPTGYDKVTLFENQYIDYLWTINKVANNTMIQNVRLYNYKPVWSSDTVLLANFDGDLGAGSVQTLNDSIILWSIYRKKTNETILNFVAKIDSINNFIIDYNVSNQTEYEYYVFPETATTVGEAMISDVLTTNWWSWSLTGIYESDINNLYYVDINNIWIFDMNINSGSMTQNINKQSYQGFSKFPKISSGEKNYLSGQLNCLIGKIENDLYIDTIEMQKSFIDFVQSGSQKILKDRKGNIFIVDTTENTLEVMDNIKEQVVSVTFNWTQIGSTEEISIIEEIV